MDYNGIVKQILSDYKKRFGIDINIVLDTKDNLLKMEPNLVISEKTAAVYYKSASHDKGGTIFMVREVFDKIKNKNYNNSNNQYDNGLAFLIHACFHELEHRKQSDYPEKLTAQKTIYPMMYQIEHFLIATYQYEKKYDRYASMHDKFISEIDADIKGNRNLRSFANHFGLPVNPSYIELFSCYNDFREAAYEPLYFINEFNKQIKKYDFKSFFDSNNSVQKQLLDFYDKNGKLKSIEEIMNLTNNPLLPYIVSSADFIESINGKHLSSEQISFAYSNIKYVIDEHYEKEKKMKMEKERLRPRFKEFIEYTSVAGETSRRSKTLETRDYSNLYKYLESVSSTLAQYLPKREESFAKRSQSETQIYSEINKKNQAIKKQKGQMNKPNARILIPSSDSSGASGNKGYTNIMLLSLIVSFVCGLLFIAIYMSIGR